jgi:hypothetical protein
VSYCRWSSDDWQSDIYAYESDYGYVIHVASQRIVDPIPRLPEWSEEPAEIMRLIHALQHQGEAVASARKEPIGLDYDGETFIQPTLDDFEAQLRELAEIGYHVPTYVFEIIESERANDPNS